MYFLILYLRVVRLCFQGFYLLLAILGLSCVFLNIRSNLSLVYPLGTFALQLLGCLERNLDLIVYLRRHICALLLLFYFFTNLLQLFLDFIRSIRLLKLLELHLHLHNIRLEILHNLLAALNHRAGLL